MLTSKRSLFSCLVRLMMPPLSANPLASPTVKVLEPLETGENPWSRLHFRRSYEDHLAGVGILVRIEFLHVDGVVTDGAAVQAFADFPLERIVSGHTDGEGRGRVSKCVSRPLHELGKVIEERQLHPVLTLMVILPKGRRRDSDQNPADYSPQEEPTPSRRSPSRSVPWNLAVGHRVCARVSSSELKSGTQTLPGNFVHPE